MSGNMLFTARVRRWNELALVIYLPCGVLKNSDWLTRQRSKRGEMVKDENHINSLCEVSLLSTAIPFAQHRACCRELTVNDSTSWDGSVVKCAAKPESLLPLSSRNARCLVLSARAWPRAGAEAAPSATGFWSDFVSSLQTGNLR